MGLVILYRTTFFSRSESLKDDDHHKWEISRTPMVPESYHTTFCLESEKEERRTLVEEEDKENFPGNGRPRGSKRMDHNKDRRRTLVPTV